MSVGVVWSLTVARFELSVIVAPLSCTTVLVDAGAGTPVFAVGVGEASALAGARCAVYPFSKQYEPYMLTALDRSTLLSPPLEHEVTTQRER
jgi:chlorite dismutase